MINRVLCEVTVGENKQTVLVHTDKAMSAEELGLAMCRIIATQQTDPNFSIRKTHEVFIKKHKAASYAYKVDKSHRFKKLATDGSFSNLEVSNLDVKMIAIANKSIPLRSRTVSEIKTTLLLKWPSKIPIISLLWKVLIYPLTRLMYLLHPGYVLDTSKMSFVKDSKGENSLISALKEIQEGNLFEPNDPISQVLNFSLKAYHSWKTLKAKDQEQCFKSWINHIADGFKEGKDILAIIPTGYWEKDGKFQATLLTFSRSGSSLLLKEFGSHHARDFLRDYEYQNFNPDDTASLHTLQKMVGQLMLFSLKKEKLPDSCLQEVISSGYLAFLHGATASTVEGASFNPMDASKINYKALYPLLDFPKLRENLVLSSGFKQGSPSEKRRPHVVDNPFTLIHEMLRSIAKDAPMASKIEFTYRLLNNHLQTTLLHFEKCEPLERLTLLKLMHKSTQSLQRQFHKLPSAERIEEMTLRFNSLLQRLEHHLKEEMGKDSTKVLKASFLNTPKPLPFQMIIEKPIALGVANVSAFQAEGLKLHHFMEVQKLKNAIDCDETMASLQAITKSCDAFIETRNYPAATQMYRMAMAYFPAPIDPNRAVEGYSFWHSLIEKKSFTAFRELSFTLERLNHYFWEAKIKQSDLKLTPTEWIQLLKSESSLLFTIRQHEKLLKSVDANDLPVMERALLNALQARKHLFDPVIISFIYAYTQEDHLSFSQSVEGQSVLASFEMCVGNENIKECMRLPTERYKEGDALWIKEAAKAFGRQLNGWDLNNILKSFYSSRISQNNDEVALALSPLARLQHHHLVITAFMASQTSIQPTFQVLKFPTYVVQIAKTAFDFSSGRSRSRSRLYASHLKALQLLQQPLRLEFAMTRWTAQREIVAANFSGSKKLRVVLDCRYQALVAEFYTLSEFTPFLTDHSDAVGESETKSPQTIYGKKIALSRLHNSKGEMFGKYKWSEMGNEEELQLTDKAMHLPGNGAALAIKQTLRVMQYGATFVRYHKKNEFKEIFLHATLDSYKNVEEVIDLWLQRRDLLDQTIMFKRFYELLTRHDVICDMRQENPHLFLKRAPLICHLLMEAKEKGNTLRLTSLLYFTTIIQVHMQQIVAGWPTLHDPVWSEHLLQLFYNPSISSDDQNAIASAFLMAYYCHENSKDLGKIESLKNEKRVASLLKMGQMLSVLGEGVDIPINAREGVCWIKEQLVPHLMFACTDEFFSKVLDGFMQLNGAALSPYPLWTRDEESFCRFSKIAFGKDNILDLSTLQLLKVNGEAFPAIVVPLPKAVREHPTYRALFADEILMGSAEPSGKANEILYRTEVPTKGVFWISFCPCNHTLTIEREFEARKRLKFQLPKMPIPEVKTPSLGFWGRFAPNEVKLKVKELTDPTASLVISANGFEERLISCGVFLDPSRLKVGYAFLNPKTFQDPVSLHFDKNGKLVKATTCDGKRIIVPLNPIITPVGPHQLLYLAKEGEEWISEIRFLDLPFSLKRKDRVSDWTFTGHPSLEHATLMIGTKPPKPIRKLLENIEESFDQCGLTLKKGQMCYLVLWPHRVNIEERKELKENLEIIAAEKQELQGLEPLIFTMDQEGKMQGSSSAFLLLGFLLAQEKDYVKACHYIEKGALVKINHPEEEKILHLLKLYFQTLPTRTLRSNAIALKGLLAIFRIQNEQLSGKSFAMPWQEFLNETTFLAKRYESYMQRVNDSMYAQDGYWQRLRESEKEVQLSDEEVLHLQTLYFQSLISITSYPKARGERALLPAETALSFNLLTQQEMGLVAQMSLLSMEKSHKSQSTILAELRPDERITTHFFELWNAIILEKLQPKDLLPLFFPPRSHAVEGELTNFVEGLAKESFEKVATGGFNKESYDFQERQIQERQFSQKIDPSLGKGKELIKCFQIDLTRRALLTLASKPAEDRGEPINLKAVWEIHRQLPQSLPSIASKMGWVAIKRFFSIQLKGERQLLASIHTLCEKIKTMGGEAVSYSYLSQAALNEAFNPLDAYKEMMKDSRGVDIEHLTTFIKSSEGKKTLGPDLTAIFTLGLKIIGDEWKGINGLISRVIPLSMLVEFLQKQFFVNVIEMARLWKNKERIAHLENAQPLKLYKDMNPALRVTYSHFTDEQIAWWKEVPETKEQKRHLHQLSSHITEALQAQTPSPHQNEMEGLKRFANTQLMEGVQCARDELLEEVSQRRSLEKEKWSALVGFIQEEIAFHEKETELKWKFLQEALSQVPNLPIDVKKAYIKQKEVGSDCLYQALRKSYQRGALSYLVEIDTAMTHLLLHKASLQVLIKGKGHALLEELRGLINTDVDPLSWIVASTKLLDLLQRALHHGRYLLPDGRLINPPLHRKAIVMEAEKGIILTDEQLDLVQKMVENPTDVYELKVGLGKTSVVFPLLLMLLIEKGKFPVAVVKESLLEQNFQALDSSTRELIEGAGVVFSLKFQEEYSALSLQEYYLKLIALKQEQGYIITTSESLLAIDQKLQLLRGEEAEKIKAMFEQYKELPDVLMRAIQNPHVDHSFLTNISTGYPELLQSYMSLNEIQLQIYYMAKIRTLFSLLMIDEIDDVQEVTNENNVGLGEALHFPMEIGKVLLELFKVGMKTKEVAKKNEDQQRIAKIFTAMTAGGLSSIDPSIMRGHYLSSLVRVAFNDPHFLRRLGIQNLFTDVPMDKIVSYFCSYEGVDLFTHQQWKQISEECARNLSTMKHLLLHSLPIALNQNPGIELGIKLDGFQVGPRVAGVDKDAIFGDPCDILANHFVFYLKAIPHSDFFEDDLKKMDTLQEGDAIYWKEQAALMGLTLLQYLNLKENWEIRLFLLEKSVIRPKCIKIFSKQIRFNVQDISYGRRCGGMTGTRNRRALPRFSEKPKEVEPKTVAAKVILEAALLSAPIIETHPSPCSLQDNPMLMRLFAIIEDNKCKAIINQGFDFGCAHVQDLIRTLREKVPSRIYVFIDTFDRTFRIWYPEEIMPFKISKEALDEKLKDPNYLAQALCYFAPPDNRGVDVRLPGGYAIGMISDKCQEEDLVQLIGRMRDAGKCQGFKYFLISEGVQDRIQADVIAYAHLVKDTFCLSIPTQGAKNLKATAESLRRISHMGVREVLEGLNEEMDNPNYWSIGSPAFRILDSYLRYVLGNVADQWLYESKGVSVDEEKAGAKMEETLKRYMNIYQNEDQKLQALKHVLGTDPFLNVLRSGVLPHVQNRVSAIEEKLEQKRKDLKKEIHLLQMEMQAQAPIPTQVPSLGGGLPIAHVHVQEQTMVQVQQQVQVQEQEQQQKGRFTKRQFKKSYPIPEEMEKAFNTFLQVNSKQGFGFNSANPLHLSQEESIAFFAFWNKSSLHITPNAMGLFCILGGFKGTLSHVRLCVESLSHSESYSCIWLLSRLDYHGGVKGLKIVLDAIRDVYTPIPTHLYPETHGFMHNERRQLMPGETDGSSRIVQDPNTPPFAKNKTLFSNMLLAKLFMGVDCFTEEETLALQTRLKDIVQNNPLLKKGILTHARHFGGTQQEALIYRLL